jgi:hypothetical protein
MSDPLSAQDLEKVYSDHPPLHLQHTGHHTRPASLASHPRSLKSNAAPFVGRIGGNQVFVLNRDDSSNAEVLQDAPDAAPGMTIAEQFDLRPLRSIGLWKAAIMEGMGE